MTMKASGSIKGEGWERQFLVEQEELRCNNCLKELHDGSVIYFCPRGHVVYCSCEISPDIHICPFHFSILGEEHVHERAVLKLKKKED